MPLIKKGKPIVNYCDSKKEIPYYIKDASASTKCQTGLIPGQSGCPNELLILVIVRVGRASPDQVSPEWNLAELIKPASTASGAWGTFWMAGEHFGQ